MAQYFSVHPENPQPRLIRAAVEIIREGGVVAYPTDSCYALGCHIGDKAAMTRIRTIRRVNERHHLTLVCRNLAEIAQYARIDNSQFRMLKATTPGSYTFILQASEEVPRRLAHPKKKTVGVRIPGHPVVQALLRELGEPMVSSTLLMPDAEDPMTDGWQIKEALDHQVEAVIDAGECGVEPSTVID